MRRYIRFLIFTALALTFWHIGGSLLWLPLALAAIFFAATDLFHIGSANKHELATESSEAENFDVDDGLLGDYLVDSTKVYGLFLKLNGQRAFIDIKRDRLIEERKKRALILYG